MTSAISLTKIYYTNLIMKRSEKPKLRNILQNNCSIIFKSSKVIKVKKNLKSIPDQKQLKRQDNQMWSRIIPIKPERSTIHYMVIMDWSWFCVMITLWLNRWIVPDVYRKCTLQYLGVMEHHVYNIHTLKWHVREKFFVLFLLFCRLEKK